MALYQLNKFGALEQCSVTEVISEEGERGYHQLMIHRGVWNGCQQ